MPIDEVRYYGENGSLYPWDIRHLEGDPAFVNGNPDGSLTIRLHTEPGFKEANLILDDGEARVLPLAKWGETPRFTFWEIRFKPERLKLRYGFALRRDDATIVYFGRSGVTHGLEFFFDLDLMKNPGFHTPAWMHGAFMYQIFPERFANGNPAINPPGTVPWGTAPESYHFQGGDLIGITQRLDYLDELGVEVIYLNPIFTSPSNHKFDASDYYNVDPAFGGNEALRELIAGAHAREIRVIVDASFNHAYPKFFAFQDIIQQGFDSPYIDWFTINRFPLDVVVRRKLLPDWARLRWESWSKMIGVFQADTGIPIQILEDDVDGPAIDPAYHAWFNVVQMPKVNLDNPETRQYFLDVAAYWVREFKIDGWRMDVVAHVTDDFWVDMRRAVREANPEAYLLAEVWGDSSFWLKGDRFDATMNYTFYQLVVNYFAKANITTETLLNGVREMLMMYPESVTAVNQNLISSHDTARFLNLAGEDRKRLALATFFQFTMPGAPGVYYGDEIGMTGERDPDCRRAFPWDREDTWDEALLAKIRTLASLRKQYPALRYGSWQAVWSGNEGMAFLREYGDERVLVVLARQEAIEDQLIPFSGASPRLIWGAGRWHSTENGIFVEYLHPWSGMILEL